MEKMAQGIEIEEGKIALRRHCNYRSHKKHNNSANNTISRPESTNQKMLDYLGFEVTSLKRVQHATIDIEGLKKGQFKPIKPQQIKELRNFLGKIKG